MKKIMFHLFIFISIFLCHQPLAFAQEVNRNVLTQSTKLGGISNENVIEIQLRTIFATNVVLEKYNLKVNTSKNAVEIKGKVKNKIEKELSTEIISSLAPNKKINNKIVVDEKYEPGTSVGWAQKVVDATITAMSKSALALDPTTSTFNTKVETTNGVVTLSGEAKTLEEKQDASTLIIHIPGVITVKNNIKVN